MSAQRKRREREKYGVHDHAKPRRRPRSRRSRRRPTSTRRSKRRPRHRLRSRRPPPSNPATAPAAPAGTAAGASSAAPGAAPAGIAREPGLASTEAREAAPLGHMQILCLSDIHGEGAGSPAILGGCPGGRRRGARRRHHAPRRRRGGGEGARADPRLGPARAGGPGNMDGEVPAGSRSGASAPRPGLSRSAPSGSSGWAAATRRRSARPSRSPTRRPAAASRPPGRSRRARFKVLISHAPPRGTRLDRALRGLHVGSARGDGSFLGGRAWPVPLRPHPRGRRRGGHGGHALCVNLGSIQERPLRPRSIEPGTPVPASR